MNNKYFFVCVFGGALSFNCMASMRSLYIAATGMAAQEANVNTISNNIANVNTIGFKQSQTQIDDLSYQTIQEPGARSSSSTLYNVGVQVGSGARVSGTRKEFSVGAPQITNNPFDLMINGEGFFGIIMPNGEIRYTRDGSFNLDAQGSMVNKQGYKLFPGFTFPPTTSNVNISDSGKIEAFTKGQTEPAQVGQIPVFTMINPTGLKSIGSNLYQLSNSSGEAIQNVAGVQNAGAIMQGTLESSNVSPMTAMTDLIRAQRAYEMNSKVLSVGDQMLQTANNIK